MPYTNFGNQQIQLAMMTGAALGTPTSWFVGFSTTTPTQVSTSNWNFTEPTIGTGGYARKSVTANGTNFGAVGSEPANGYTVQNATAITVATSTAAWSTGATALTYMGLWDASTAGNLWLFAPCSPTVVVNTTGVIVSFPIGAFLNTNN